MLSGKNILIGICGGIAAYKTQSLIRLLVKENANVKVVMTHEACNFVTPLTVSVLSQNPVIIDPYDKNNGQWNSHIDIALWADAFVVAPLTANTLAKMASGITDNMLLAIYLSCRTQLFIAPTMDVDMFEHSVTQDNIKKLKQNGAIVIEPTEGSLASGLIGKGRMEEPENILKVLQDFFSKKQTLKGKKVLISSGPTVEDIDPVRYISNYSSGKMGKALALEAANRGATVCFVSGPVNEYPEHSNIKVIKVKSSEQMYNSCIENYDDVDIAIMAAAVADYTVAKPEKQKIKKTNDDNLTLELKKTKDILKELGARKKKQLLVGFALETNNEKVNALAKLNSKNLDFIVLNSLNDKGAGFRTDTNKISIFKKNGEVLQGELKSKEMVAKDIFDAIGK